MILSFDFMVWSKKEHFICKYFSRRRKWPMIINRLNKNLLNFIKYNLETKNLTKTVDWNFVLLELFDVSSKTLTYL